MKNLETKYVMLISVLVLGIAFMPACQQGQRAGSEAQAEQAANEPAGEESPMEDPARQELAQREAELAQRERDLEQERRKLAERQAEATRAEQARPAYEPVLVNLPASTTVAVEFLETLSSETNKAGDTFRARIAADLVHEGLVVIPRGTPIDGRVIEAADSKRIGGRAKLGLEFQRAVLPSGTEIPINASFADAAKSQTGKDAATIGGATAGGAILGRVVGGDDKDKATLIGAVVGAAVGTAVAAETKGQAVVIEAGTVIDLMLDQPVQVKVNKPTS